MSTHLITYNDELVATVSSRRVHFVPPVDQLADADPLRRFVYAMAACARDVATGEIPGPYTAAAAELYARTLLIDDERFDARAEETDEDLAACFSVPLEQVALKRVDRLEHAR